MALPPYQTGTVTVVNGSDQVVGLGTAWVLNLVAGGTFFLAGLSFPVLSVEDDNHMTLALPWSGSSGSALPYAIVRQDAQASDVIWTNDRLREILTRLALAGIHPNSSGTIADRDALTLGVGDKGYLFLYADPPNDLSFYRWDGTAWEGPYPVRGEGDPSLATPILQSAIVAAAAADEIVVGKWYYITDIERVAFGIDVDEYHVMPKVTVSLSAPPSPTVDDVWIDKN